MVSFFASFLTLQTCWQSFRLENITVTVSVNLPTQWHVSIRSGKISQPSLPKIFKTFSSRASPDTSQGMPTISRHSCLEYWVFAQHRVSKLVHLVDNKLLAFFVTASSAALKLAHKVYVPPPELYCLYLPICFVGTEPLVWDLVCVVYLVSRQCMLPYFSW